MNYRIFDYFNCEDLFLIKNYVVFLVIVVIILLFVDLGSILVIKNIYKSNILNEFVFYYNSIYIF